MPCARTLTARAAARALPSTVAGTMTAGNAVIPVIHPGDQLVIEDDPAMMAARVTHELSRMLLPRYAAGVLAPADAEAVRAHLATGCTDCLAALYRMPVGMPRDIASGEVGSNGPMPSFRSGRAPAPAGPASGAGSSWVARAVGL